MSEELRTYISQPGLIHQVLTEEELVALAEPGREVNMMMGQTFDGGQPIEMLKYALTMTNLSDLLTAGGANVTANWLIADHFITDINEDADVATARANVNARVEYLTRLNEAFGGNIGFVLSSELSKTGQYQDNLRKLRTKADRNPEFRAMVLRSVPEDRRSHPKALDYPFEELATVESMDTDVKVGPPYEALYDEPAREFAPLAGFKRFVGIHLTPSFPFGKPKIDDETRRQIEAFGILPYKIDSKGVARYRIDPINDNLSAVKNLVRATADKRALVDLLLIGEMAQQRKDGVPVGPTFFGKKGPEMLKSVGERTFESDPPYVPYGRRMSNLVDSAIAFYEESIHKPLRE